MFFYSMAHHFYGKKNRVEQNKFVDVEKEYKQKQIIRHNK